jgi:hypothetical protein
MNITGANGNTYITPLLTKTTFYRVISGSGTCGDSSNKDSA